MAAQKVPLPGVLDSDPVHNQRSLPDIDNKPEKMNTTKDLKDPANDPGIDAPNNEPEGPQKGSDLLDPINVDLVFTDQANPVLGKRQWQEVDSIDDPITESVEVKRHRDL